MIVWGGIEASQQPTATGGIYDPKTRVWTPTSPVNAPSARSQHTAVWDAAAKRMLVWGGVGSAELGDGAAFDPVENTWASISANGAPSPRVAHTAVWTGSRMVIWGGFRNGNYLADGFSYAPGSGAWTQLDGTNAPSGRRDHAAGVSGTRMVVWGGFDNAGSYLADGAVYDFGTSMWSVPANLANGPGGRSQHTAVVSADGEVLFFGGRNSGTELADGGKYDPSNDTWTPFASNAPQPRLQHSAVWMISGNKGRMLVWGGRTLSGPSFHASGWALNAGPVTWAPLSSALSGRASHTAVAASEAMIVWGGETATNEYTNTGAVFDFSASP
jgi:hypothetical protein